MNAQFHGLQANTKFLYDSVYAPALSRDQAEAGTLQDHTLLVLSPFTSCPLLASPLWDPKNPSPGYALGEYDQSPYAVVGIVPVIRSSSLPPNTKGPY